VDRLSIPATEALQAADREARVLHHGSVGVAHVLLGLASTPGGAVRRALLRRSVLADEVRDRVAELAPPEHGPLLDLTRTPLERLVHALRDETAGGRPISTTDLLRAVTAAGDPVADTIIAELGGADELLFAASAEELLEVEPARVVPEPRVRPRSPLSAIARDQPVAETFEVLLEIRTLLRVLAERQVAGDAAALELRIAADLEAAVASARLRLAEDRRGGIGSPRADDLAQRRFVTALREAHIEAMSFLSVGEIAASSRR
jgi:hypothetical protein